MHGSEGSSAGIHNKGSGKILLKTFTKLVLFTI